MKKFNIEHIGIMVSHPIEMGIWYRDVLGFNIVHSAQGEDSGVTFLSDANNKVVLEFGKAPNVEPLSELTNHHLQLHIAVKSDDPEEEAKYLISKGATYIENREMNRPEDILIVLLDPWGNTIQLVKRESF